MTPKDAKKLEKEFGKDSEVYKVLVEGKVRNSEGNLVDRETDTTDEELLVTYTGALPKKKVKENE